MINKLLKQAARETLVVVVAVDWHSVVVGAATATATSVQLPVPKRTTLRLVLRLYQKATVSDSKAETKRAPLIVWKPATATTNQRSSDPILI